ncbi:alpha/beta fold hydrolase [Flexibacter flexilis]|nr:alpha/beta hydrolase [Flexibacter flexilis]
MKKQVKLSNGQQIAYTDSGDGNVMVWVHGLTSYKEIWERNIHTFSKYFRCVALDLPGHGESANAAIGATYSPQFFADTLFLFLEELKINRCTLVGHSMGGQVALLAAIQKPELFSEVVLVAPAGCEPFTETEKILLQRYSSVGIVGASWFGQTMLNLKSHFGKLNEHEHQALERLARLHESRGIAELAVLLSQCIAGMLNQSVIEQLPQIKIPVLLIFGKEDKLIPNKLIHGTMTTEEIARNTAAAIPNCKLKLWDEAGHYVQYEYAAAVNMEIYKFMNRKIFTT